MSRLLNRILTSAIVSPHQKPPKTNIVLRSVQRTKLDAVLQKARKQRMTTKDFDYGGEGTPIYVNELLTRSSKIILGAAIAKKKRDESSCG